jgi:chromosome segregation ATPase
MGGIARGEGFMDFQPMSPEEMQRTMQFLLQQQARFDAGMEQLREKTERISDAMIGLTGIVGRVADRVERLAEAQQETDRQLRELREALTHTDVHINDVESHLNILIAMFERHLREDHGHRPS